MVGSAVQPPQWRVVSNGDDFNQFPAVIAAGANLSASVDMTSSRLNSIWVPSNWTNANLTFQSSPDGVNYGEMSDDSGIAITVNVASIPGFIILSKPSQWLGARYLKVRSGTVGSPVTQSQAVTLLLFALP
jgi:hypothetical protein